MVNFLETHCPVLRETAARIISRVERQARADNSPTRSGPEGSSRNEFRSGRCPASHPFPAFLRSVLFLFADKGCANAAPVLSCTQGLHAAPRIRCKGMNRHLGRGEQISSAMVAIRCRLGYCLSTAAALPCSEDDPGRDDDRTTRPHACSKGASFGFGQDGAA